MIRVNAAHLDEAAIIQEMQYHPAESQTAAKNKACEALIIAELIKQRARELGIVAPDAEIKDEKSDSCLDTLLTQEVEIPSASDDDCRTYFANNPQKFTTTPLLEARHILLDAAPDDAQARSEALAHAQQLISQLQANIELFAELASLHSRCPSAKLGGQLGQLGKGQTVPEFERQLFNCPIGLVSTPIESRYGVHVVMVDHREAGRPLTYDMVKHRIADYLNERVRRKAIAQYIATLVSAAEIEGYEFGLSSSPLLQ